MFSTAEWDARAILRGGGSDDELANLVRDCVQAKAPAHGINTVEFIRPELAKANVACEVEIDEALPAVAFDEGQIRQALLNLIRNAREAMQPNGGRLWVRVKSNGAGG